MLLSIIITKKILPLFDLSKLQEPIFTEADIRRIEAVIKLHYTKRERHHILEQNIFKLVSEIEFITGKDLLRYADVKFIPPQNIHTLDEGYYLVKLENVKKGSGIFLNMHSEVGYYYVLGTNGTEAYVKHCGSKDPTALNKVS